MSHDYVRVRSMSEARLLERAEALLREAGFVPDEQGNWHPTQLDAQTTNVMPSPDSMTQEEQGA